MVNPEYHVSELASEALEAVADGIRRSVDLIDVMHAISAAATLAAESLAAIERDLLKIREQLDKSSRPYPNPNMINPERKAS
jgi:hypothetical protein